MYLKIKDKEKDAVAEKQCSTGANGGREEADEFATWETNATETKAPEYISAVQDDTHAVRLMARRRWALTSSWMVLTTWLRGCV